MSSKWMSLSNCETSSTAVLLFSGLDVASNYLQFLNRPKKPGWMIVFKSQCTEWLDGTEAFQKIWKHLWSLKHKTLATIKLSRRLSKHVWYKPRPDWSCFLNCTAEFPLVAYLVSRCLALWLFMYTLVLCDLQKISKDSIFNIQRFSPKRFYFVIVKCLIIVNTILWSTNYHFISYVKVLCHTKCIKCLSAVLN